jgi:hypothetical protein
MTILSIAIVICTPHDRNVPPIQLLTHHSRYSPAITNVWNFEELNHIQFRDLLPGVEIVTCRILFLSSSLEVIVRAHRRKRLLQPTNSSLSRNGGRNHHFAIVAC